MYLGFLFPANVFLLVAHASQEIREHIIMQFLILFDIVVVVLHDPLLESGVGVVEEGLHQGKPVAFQQLHEASAY